MLKACSGNNIHYFKLFVDGASRNNPGQAGVGIYILKDGEPVGIVTERDVTRKSLLPAKGKKVYERPVSRLMSHPLITVPSTTPMWKAFETMVTKKIRRLPIERQGRLVGIVTERDLFRWALRVFYEPNIPKHIRKFL